MNKDLLDYVDEMSARRRAARRKLKQLKGTCNYSDDLDLDDDNDDELGQ